MFIQVTGVTFKTIEHEEWSEELNTMVTTYETTSEIKEEFKVILATNQIAVIEEMEGTCIIHFNNGKILDVKESIKTLQLLLLTGNICHFN